MRAGKASVVIVWVACLVVLCRSLAFGGSTWGGAGTGGNTATDPSDNSTLWSRPSNWIEGRFDGSAYVSFTNAGYLNAESGSAAQLYVSGPSLDGAFHVGTGVSFTTNDLRVGRTQSGRILQTGGSLTVKGQYLFLGEFSGSNALYELENGTLTATALSYYEVVGNQGTGTFHQNGGTHTAGDLRLGYYAGSNGTYRLDNGTLSVTTETIGLYGTGSFQQTGGTQEMNYLSLGKMTGSTGSYQLDGGSLTVHRGETLATYAAGTAIFHQTGGAHTADCDLQIGQLAGSTATYQLDNGTLSVGQYEWVSGGHATFLQTGGEIHVKRDVRVGYSTSMNGICTQLGGSNSIAGSLILGFFGSYGEYTLTAGELVVGGSLEASPFFRFLGAKFGVDGGSLTAGDLRFGTRSGRGTFNITNSSANVNVRNSLTFGDNSIFTAVPGSIIHMTGARFFNQTDNAAALAGLANVKMLFEGGPAYTSTFELAGRDFGRSLAGFKTNFNLGTLALGSADNLGLVRLLDDYNNSNRGGVGGNAEALYVGKITLGAGSTLDLNGFHVYTQAFDNAAGGKAFNGSLFSMVTGDANGDWKVDGGDLALWQQNYDPLGLDNNTFASGDFNGDGKVDGGDLALWQQNYNPLGIAGMSADGMMPLGNTMNLNGVPEPATVALLAMGLGVAASGRLFNRGARRERGGRQRPKLG